MYFHTADCFNYATALWKALFQYDCNALQLWDELSCHFQHLFSKTHPRCSVWLSSLTSNAVLLLYANMRVIYSLVSGWIFELLPFLKPYPGLLQYIFLYICPGGQVSEFLWGIYFVADLLTHKICVCLTILEVFIFRSLYRFI